MYMHKRFANIRFGEIKYILVVFILVCIEFIYMHYSILSDTSVFSPIAYVENAVTSFIDTLLFLFFPLLLINRRKYIYIVLLLLIDIYILANIWYGRNFGIYLPVSLYWEFDNLSGLCSNIMESIRFSDVILLPLNVLTLLILYKRYPCVRIKERFRVCAVFILVGIILVFTLIGYYRIRGVKYSVLINEKVIGVYSFMPAESTFRLGMFYHWIMDSRNSSKKNYTEEELGKIESFFKLQTSICEKYPKNLIIIIVESLLSFADDLSFAGKEITPYLNQLKKEKTYYNANVLPQTELGESSDGQFIYMTGLLPLKNVVTVMSYLNNTYLALPYLLKQQKKVLESRMIIPTGPTFWRQRQACKTYGIDSLFSRNDYVNADDEWLNDEEIFDMARFKDERTVQPFLSIILTSSMHSPYTEFVDIGEDFEFPSDYSNELKNYLLMLHYTDKQIGSYIESLKFKGLYDESLIVITSDHEAHAAFLKLSPKQKHFVEKIPLYMVNVPCNMIGTHDNLLGQIDVFPTLLDLMGVSGRWRGLGRSVLNNESCDSIMRKEINAVSEMIIYADYFRNYAIDKE